MNNNMVSILGSEKELEEFEDDHEAQHELFLNLKQLKEKRKKAQKLQKLENLSRTLKKENVPFK